MANNMIVESPTAAHRLRDGAMLVAIGRTMPRPPTISANPMKAATPRVMPTGPFFSDWALNFSYANSFNEPTAMKANARSPWTIHRVRFMHLSFLISIISMSSLGTLCNKSLIFAEVFVRSALLSSCCSKFALLNQTRLNLRNPRLGLTQRFRACMYGVGAQDKVVIMRHSRAKDELCIGLGLEFDYGGRRLECHQFALLQFVRNQNGTHLHGGPEDSVPGGWLVAPPFSSFQMHGEIVHRRRSFDRTGRASVSAEEDTRWSIVGNNLR